MCRGYGFLNITISNNYIVYEKMGYPTISMHVRYLAKSDFYVSKGLSTLHTKTGFTCV